MSKASRQFHSVLICLAMAGALVAAVPASGAVPKIKKMEAEYLARTVLDVHREPSAQSKKLMRLDRGTGFMVTGRVIGTDWYRVRTDRGRIGFVSGKNIEVAPWARFKPPTETKPTQKARKQQPRPKPKKRLEVRQKPRPEPKVQARVAPPAPFEPSASFKDCPRCPELIRLPAGEFNMGMARSDPSERPVHRVRLATGFAMGRFEVTVDEWMACVENGGCDYKPEPATAPKLTPMRNLSWEDALQYVRWLSKVTGKAYRLPSEAEWEYAARGGTTTAYWWGDRMAPGKANCRDCGGDSWQRNSPSQVGSYAANPFGLHDMNGGVAEWTADCWFDNYKRAPTDGSPRVKRICRQRGLRGGSWRHKSEYLRSAARLFYDVGVQYIAHGLRVVRAAN